MRSDTAPERPTASSRSRNRRSGTLPAPSISCFTCWSSLAKSGFTIAEYSMPPNTRPSKNAAAAVQNGRFCVAAWSDSMAVTAACIWPSASGMSAPFSTLRIPCWYCARCRLNALASTTSSRMVAPGTVGSCAPRFG